MKIIALTLSILLTLQGFPLAQEAGKSAPAPEASADGAAPADAQPVDSRPKIVPERPHQRGLLDPGAADKGSKLKELIKILESITDDDYTDAVSQAPKKDAQSPQTVSREAALEAAYSNLAALQYSEAAQAEPKDEKYQKASDRLGAPTETGWAVDLLQWLGNAAINYALQGGTVYVGRELDASEAGKLRRKAGSLEDKLSKAKTEKKEAKDAFELGEVYEQLASAAVKPAPAEVREAQKEDRFKRLAALLRSMSDADYRRALIAISPETRKNPAIATRDAALRSCYKSLADFELRAANPSPSGQDLVETGWAVDLLKWLGNAAINYALSGGEVYVGRKLKLTEADKLEKKAHSLEDQLASAGTDAQRTELHLQLSQTYKALASLPSQETSEDRVQVSKIRLAELAELLQAVTDDEYAQAVGEVRGKNKKLAPRKQVLRSAYKTLAALEYRDAGAKAEGDLKRVSQQDAADVAVDPQTLQETGLFTDMLEIATVGGVGWLIYKNEKDHHRGRVQPYVQAPAVVQAPPPVIQAPSPSAPPSPVEVTSGTVVFQRPPVVPAPVPEPAPSVGRVQACPESLGGCIGHMPAPIYRPLPAEPTVVALYQTRDGLLAQLGGDVSDDKAADVHQQLGGLYEKLADNAAPGKRPAPKAERKPEPKPAPKAEPEAEKAPEAVEPAGPTKDELLKQQMKEMDDLEKEMKEKVERARPQQAEPQQQ